MENKYFLKYFKCKFKIYLLKLWFVSNIVIVIYIIKVVYVYGVCM